MLHLAPFESTHVHPLAAAARAIDPDRIRIAAAFATEAGLEVLRSKLIKNAVFDAADTRALLGVQQGVTQPEVLERLLSGARSQVRVPFGVQALESPGLRAPMFFHPKIYAFERTSSRTIAIVSGSANLTYSALRTNVENLLVWTGKASDAVAVEFDAWWAAMWTSATIVNSAFIENYRSARPRTPTPPSIPQSGPNGPSATSLWQAQVLWVELVRKPEGASFNQPELLLTAHHFFYPNEQSPSRAQPRILTFTDSSGRVYNNPNRSIRFNGPPLRATGNSMWRVYMPTESEGLTGYQDGDVLLRFDRTPTADRYLVSIADASGPEAAAWIARSSGIATKAGARPRRMGWW